MSYIILDIGVIIEILLFLRFNDKIVFDITDGSTAIMFFYKSNSSNSVYSVRELNVYKWFYYKYILPIVVGIHFGNSCNY